MRISDVLRNKGATVASRQARRTRERLTWVEADLTTWEIPGEFDLILYVYIHLRADQRATVLQRMAHALAPGGTLHTSSAGDDGVGSCHAGRLSRATVRGAVSGRCAGSFLLGLGFRLRGGLW